MQHHIEETVGELHLVEHNEVVMKSLKDSLAELSGLRKNFEEHVNLAAKIGAVSHRSRLVDFGGFGSNPGNLRMLTHVPPNLPKTPALVVALHGCTQTASAYDYGSGWSALADAFGFAVLFPEQQAANNPNRCFNWYLKSDTQRGHGEAHSIHEMIERMTAYHGVDRSRIFVVGLSAGGAMAAAMLANYPDVFAAGAVIAGLPYGAATNVQTAFEAMAGKLRQTDRDWGAHVRDASSHKGPWPKISIWHGTGDTIVNPTNMEHTVCQWRTVHGASSAPDIEHMLNGHARRVWKVKGEQMIEAISIAGMAHGVPLASGASNERWGNVSPFHLDVGLSSSRHILQFWNLANVTRTEEVHEPVARSGLPQVSRLKPDFSGEQSDSASVRRPPDFAAPSASSVITAALTASGVLKAGGNMSPKDPRGIIAATLRSVGLLKD